MMQHISISIFIMTKVEERENKVLRMSDAVSVYSLVIVLTDV